MKRAPFLGLLLLFSSYSLFAQTHQLTNSPTRQLTSFTDRWKKVDSLTDLGLPKSALAIVDRIYDQAKKDGNDPQFIKAILVRLKLKADYREDVAANSIREIKKEIRDAHEPVRQILYSILGETYQSYYEQNIYRFEDRTEVVNNNSDSIQTWDLKTLRRHSVVAWLQSLQNPVLLKALPIGQFEDILVKQGNPGEKSPKNRNNNNYRPSLFDFLSWRALDSFSTNANLDEKAATGFSIDQESYFGQADEFGALKLDLPLDSSSLQAFSLQIYHDLALFHLQDKAPRALIDEEIQRFKFLKVYSIVPGKDSLYLESLKKLEQSYITFPFSTDVTYEIAFALKAEGSEYQPFGLQKNKWDLKKAMEYCNSAIARFPESGGAKNCKLLAAEIQKPNLQIQANSAVVPDQPSLGLIEFKNLKKLYFRLAKIDPDANKDNEVNRSREDQVKYYSNLPFQKTWSLALPNDGDFQSHRMEIRIPELPVGFYALIASSDSAFRDTAQVIVWSSFFSTQISYISQRNDKGVEEIFVLDRELGTPLKDVRVEVFTNTFTYQKRKYETIKLGEYITDESGHFMIPAVNQNSSSRLFFQLYLKEDYYVSGNFYQYPVNEPVEKTSLKTFFFTDRAIYRPGQTVYFKGILLENKGGDFSIKPGVQTTTVFTDVNGQKIAEKEFTSNEFGSFNGSFVIPQGLLTGEMTLSNGSGSISFSVEEYKRPTFEVSFDPIEGNYRLNDSVTLKGKATAYAGNNIDGAKVKYRVVRSARFPYWDKWWYPMPSVPETEIRNGILKTASDGSFKITFKAIPDPLVEKATEPVFDYVIDADVTDINGETQSANESVSVGYVSLLIGIDIPEKLDPAHDTLFHLTATNLNGRNTPVSVTLNLQRLRQPNQFYRKREWKNPDLFCMSEKDFHASFPYDLSSYENIELNWPMEDEILIKEFNTSTDSIFRFSQIATKIEDGRWTMEDGRVLQSGNYLITLKAKDSFGESVEKKIPFVIYSPSTESVPVQEIDWFVPVKTTCEPGEKAKFLIGSKAENVNVLFEIRVHDTLFSRQWIKLNNNQTLIEIPIQEGFRGNFSVNFAFIRYNRTFQHSAWVYVPFTNKKLDIKFETFRDKLIPGQTEEWKIRIADATKKGVKAEYLTAMYDASLDVFASNNWSFSILHDYYSSLPWNFGGFTTSTGNYYPLFYNRSEYASPIYDELDLFGFELSRRGRYPGYKGGEKKEARSSGMPRPVMMLASESASSNSSIPPPPPPPPSPKDVPVLDGLVKSTNKEVPKAEKTTSIQVRRNFQETAFFFPSLVTDSAGNLDVKFTIPESLTKWKILGLAHTKELKYGLIEKELTTHKNLMVFPNAPRFVRQGDTRVFSAKVVNLSGQSLKGEVVLELSDALSGKALNLLVSNNQTQSFEITGQSQAFQWKIAIPNDPGLSVLQYRITAKAGDFSDGEENAFPVLTNRMLVTEAMPLPVRGKEPIDFKFDKLLNSASAETLKNYKLTLEFASNPIWYAIQALPTMDDPKYPNADNVFRSYYSNAIGFFIANSNPVIKQVFESWKSLSNDALVSNLMKNEQLKSALLQETPWVMEAQDETQRKHRLGLFFDINNMENRLTQNLGKLRQMQSPSGGWPWFEGMPENRYISQEIVSGLGHLDHLGIKSLRNDKDSWSMLTRAIGYLDGEMIKDYNDIKRYYPKTMDEDHLGNTQIQYLYVRSYYLADIPLKDNKELNTAFQYFQLQAEKFWIHSDLFCQGMIGLALNRSGNKTVPTAILKSLSEKALHSKEFGMYWASQNSYEWYQAPIETQALLMEAYDELASDRNSVEEMKVWLLKQKQTQDWKTGRATAEACYALLLRGTDQLTEKSEVKIDLGNEHIQPEKLADTKVEAGTGYFQIFRNGREITPEMGNVRITKSNEGVAWGALYWQYFEDLDKITPHQTPLKVEKKLFIERVTPAGKVLVPITNYLPAGRQANLRITKGQKDSHEDIKIGDKVIVRIILSVDRNLEFVHMKDMRASAFEPPTSEQMSGYHFQDGLGYYQSTTDAATNFFFDYLPRGTWVFEYPLIVNAAGDYSNGITNVQCMYAPEFGAHSEGFRVSVGN